jgi:2-methylisocitrate lyase-like PEP mutase family enzyme
MSIGSEFRALHGEAGAFIIPNPWDAGTARILAGMGFKALATTSAGVAFSLGVADGHVGRKAMLAHCRAMVAATPLPVSADLEKGFGDTPQSVAQTISAAAATGLAGCSIEDFSGDRGRPIYDFALAVERVAAAVEARGRLAGDFVLTARAENFLHGTPDLDDTIARLQAFEAAGADVLYAPGLRDIATIAAVCSAVGKPVNILAPPRIGLAALAEAGAKRISVGSHLARAAFGAFVAAAREMAAAGTFTYAAEAIGFAEMNGFFADYPDA